jgi:kynureninase
MRFGFAPLYNGFEDAWLAAASLSEILATREWDRTDFRRKQTVT